MSKKALANAEPNLWQAINEAQSAAHRLRQELEG